MKCKQGDLARVICGPDAGKVVTCLEALPPGWRRDDLPPFIDQRIAEEAGPLWRVDRRIDWGEKRLYFAPDKALMPITPDESARLREEADAMG